MESGVVSLDSSNTVGSFLFVILTLTWEEILSGICQSKLDGVAGRLSAVGIGSYPAPSTENSSFTFEIEPVTCQVIGWGVPTSQAPVASFGEVISNLPLIKKSPADMSLASGSLASVTRT